MTRNGTSDKQIDKIFTDYPYEIIRKWRGAILEPARGLASIGPIDHKQVLYATAFSGNGMTYSAISAIIFKDIIDGKKNSWLKTYLPTRTISTRTLKTKENRKA